MFLCLPFGAFRRYDSKTSHGLDENNALPGKFKSLISCCARARNARLMVKATFSMRLSFDGEIAERYERKKTKIPCEKFQIERLRRRRTYRGGKRGKPRVSRVVASSPRLLFSAPFAQPVPLFSVRGHFFRSSRRVASFPDELCNEEMPPSRNAVNWPKINAAVERLSLLRARIRAMSLCLLSSRFDPSALFSLGVTRSVTTDGFLTPRRLRCRKPRPPETRISVAVF